MTRLAIISDVHGNLFALQAALAYMGRLNVDSLVCLGDIVGYGPNPGECIDLVVKYCECTVKGNHDEAVVDPDCAEAFNGAAREALEWTRRELGPLHLNALVQLPDTALTGPNDEILCVHDCPAPGPSTYIHDKRMAAVAFSGFDTQICLVGHTHVPMVFETTCRDATPAPECAETDAETDAEPDAEPAADVEAGADTSPVPAPTDLTAFIPSHEVAMPILEGHRYICNPGSVGQPRDCDPRASFAMLDTEARTFTVHRVEYDIAAAQAATLKIGLPTILADRLAVGA